MAARRIPVSTFRVALCLALAWTSAHSAWPTCGLLPLRTGEASETFFGEVSTSDRDALLDLYASTEGASWTENLGWGDPPGSECSWFGVQCALCGNFSCVVDLCLEGNGLAGSLPDSIGSLADLRELDLRNNDIGGELPEGLTALTSLEILRLGGNRLGGEVLAGFGNLELLQILDLSNNQLAGELPSSLRNAFSLLTLDLRSNRLRDLVPHVWLDLFYLENLYLQYNAVTTNREDVLAFVEARDPLGNWLATQTLPPTRLSAAAAGASAISLSWEPIDFSGTSGFYRIRMSTSPEGPFEPVADTESKLTDQYLVSDLEPGTTYYFNLLTYSLPHSQNQNTVVSDASKTAEATTSSDTGQVHFDPPTAEGSERDDRVSIRLVRADGGNGTAQVSYRTNALTATPGIDYTERTGTITWMDGETRAKAFTVPILDDEEVEPVETVELILENAVGAVLGEPSTIVLSILDDDFEVVDLPVVSETGSSPAVAVDRLGRQVITWQEDGLAGATDGAGVFGRFYGTDGQPSGPAVAVDTGSSGAASAPTAGMDADGRSILLWARRQNAGATTPGLAAQAEDWGIFGTWIEPDGTPSGEEIVVETGLADEPSPRLDTEPNGSLVAAWASQGRARGRRFPRGSTTGGPPFTASDPSTQVMGAPAIANSDFGQTLVTWQGSGSVGGVSSQADDAGVFGVFLDEGGEPAGEPFSIETETAATVPTTPDVSATPNGEYVAVWETSRSDGTSVIRGRRYGRDRQPRGAAFDVSQVPGRHHRPRVASNAAGNFAVVWEAETAQGSGIFGRYYGSDGGPAGTDLPIALSDGATQATAPDVTFADQQRIDVVYQRVADDATSAGVHRAAIYPPPRAGDCISDAQHLCLNQDRFRVSASWRDFEGRTGEGQAVTLTDDTGYFWFFREENIELILKVLDGRVLTDHYWVFYGALSNVEYTITVTDTLTGITKIYFNSPGQFASLGDTQALPSEAIVLPKAPPSASETELAALGTESWIDLSALEAGVATEITEADCVADATHLCLNLSRFRIEASWRTTAGATGSGQAVPLTSDTGYFWFFDSANVELVVKVLDGRPLTGSWWVFYGALSNVEYTITVTDTLTGNTATYFNPQDRFGSVGDTGALPGD